MSPWLLGPIVPKGPTRPPDLHMCKLICSFKKKKKNINGFDKDYGAKYLKRSKALKSTVFRARKVQRDFSLMPLIANSYE